MRKRILLRAPAVILFVLCAIFLCTAVSAGSLVSDGAAFLTETQAEELNTRLEKLLTERGVQAAIVTEHTMTASDAETAANGYFDAIVDSTGTESPMLLLYVSREPRAYYLLADDVFTDGMLADIEDEFLDFLRSDDYSGAFFAYADAAETVLFYDAEKEEPDFGGEIIPEDIAPTPTEEFYTAEKRGVDGANLAILAAAVLGLPLIAAFVLVQAKLNRMNTVVETDRADSFVKYDSMRLVTSRDIFLYSNLVRTPKPKPQQHSHSGTRSAGFSGGSASRGGGRVGRGGGY